MKPDAPEGALFTTEQGDAIVGLVIAFVVAAIIGAAVAAWVVVRSFPARAIAPLAPLVPAVMVARLLAGGGGSLLVAPLLAGLALAVIVALRTPAAATGADGSRERTSSPALSALRLVLVGAPAVWGVILAGRGRLALGTVLLCATPLAARAHRLGPATTAARGRWQLVGGWVAAGLAAAACAAALEPVVPDLEGFPLAAGELRARAFARLVASAPMLAGSVLLLALSGVRPRILLRVDAAIVALCFGAAAGAELWRTHRAAARLHRITEADLVFSPPRGWSELPRPELRPMRLYERRDGRESVLLLPLLPRPRPLAVFDWCRARGAAAAAQMAEQLEEGTRFLDLEWQRGGGCSFQGSLTSPAQAGTARFGYLLCGGDGDPAAVAYLHVWRDGWTMAPADVATFGPSTPRRSISQYVRCR